MFVHVLCLIDDEHGFCDEPGFDLAFFNTSHRVRDYILRSFERTGSSQQVEAVGVEGFYRNIVGGVSDQFHKSGLKLCRGGAGEGEHQKLVAFHVLKHGQ